MQITRRFTREGQDPFAGLTVRPADLADRQPGRLGRLRDEGRAGPGGLVAGRRGHPRAEVLPQGRRAAQTEPRRRGRRARWLQRSRPAAATRRPAARPTARQVFRRLAGCWTYWGWKGGYFSHRGATPGRSTTRPATCWRRRWRRRTARSGSTPACTGPTASRARRRGTTTSIPHTSEMTRSTSAYERPAPHACFIQSINDDLVNEGGIMDLWVREARIFKYGSRHRLELLRTCAAKASRSPAAASRRGLMSFLKIGDRAAGAIKSRRHHPPRRQDGRPRSRPSGHRGVRQLEGGRGAEGRRPGHRLASCSTGTSTPSSRRSTRWPERRREVRPRRKNADLRKAILDAQRGLMPDELHRPRDPAGQAGVHARSRSRSTTPTGTRRRTTPSRGQNSNNSVRITNDFMKAVAGRRPLAPLLADGEGEGDEGGPRRRSRRRRCKARDLWDQIAYAAWALRRPRRAVRHHVQRMAHLPGRRADQCVESVLASTCSSTTPPAISRR